MPLDDERDNESEELAVPELSERQQQEAEDRSADHSRGLAWRVPALAGFCGPAEEAVW